MSTKTIHNKYQIEIRASNQDEEDQDHEMQGLIQEKEDQNHDLSTPRVESMSIKTMKSILSPSRLLWI
jgi:predicted transcriptional regulator